MCALILFATISIGKEKLGSPSIERRLLASFHCTHLLCALHTPCQGNGDQINCNTIEIEIAYKFLVDAFIYGW